MLAQVETTTVGRAFAAYGGIYIAASVLWMCMAEERRPDRWDVIGTAIRLVGAAIILTAPRATYRTGLEALATVAVTSSVE